MAEYGLACILLVVKKKEVAIKEFYAPLQDKITFKVDQMAFLGLYHENLVTYLGCSVSSSLNQNYVSTVSERVVGNSLSTIIYLFKDFTFDDNWTVALQISKALLYLHSNGIAHKNLKPTNVLVYGDKLVKISDYHIQDLINCTKQHTMTTSRVVSTSRVNLGTLSVIPGNLKHNVCWYHSPQILLDIIGNDEWMAADVYAFGVILYELFTKKVPWDLDSEDEIRKAVCCGKRPIFPEEFITDRRTEKIALLTSRCWEGNNKDRPTFLEIVNVLSNKDDSSNQIQTKTQVNRLTSAVSGPTQSTQSTRVTANRHPSHTNQYPPTNVTTTCSGKTETYASTRVSARSLQQHNKS